MHPKDISIRDFTYALPEEKIARFPLSKRDDSRLLIYRQGKITEDKYAGLPIHLPENALLVFNNTKVIEARLLFTKASGGVIEIFCLEQHEQYHSIAAGLMQTASVRWKCLIGGASKWKKGQILGKKITVAGKDLLLQASMLEKRTQYFIIEFSWLPSQRSFGEILHEAGSMPLPPYLKRAAGPADAERYQTVYAKERGSVAAPTAGLHFTPDLLTRLAEKKIPTEELTLHVGAGTFMPVKTDGLGGHVMHEEFFEVTLGTLNNLVRHLDGYPIAVGTTSLRTLESLFWLGLKIMASPDTSKEPLLVGQWDPYSPDQTLPSPKKVLEQLVHWISRQPAQRLTAKTQLLIAPGYSFKIVRGLITNFHQPQSTLLLLVAALVGKDWEKIYSFALENNYRFLSYGDGCLLLT
jgi:S-adenosylmethionine:tRNA ribosyltransferase-isomerase